MLLEVNNASLSYGEAQILKDCNLKVEPGSSIALVGPSGTGKSTLLSIAGLLMKPDEGEVFIDGTPVSTMDDKQVSDIRNKRIGYVFQSTQLIGSLTVLDNILVPGLLGGVSDMNERAQELLESMGMMDWRYHYPSMLSVGQQRRASLIRALMLNPEIVFADEPTNDLDEENARIVEDTLLDVAKQGGSLVMVTHSREFAKKADMAFEIKDCKTQSVEL